MFPRKMIARHPNLSVKCSTIAMRVRVRIGVGNGTESICIRVENTVILRVR